MCTADQVTSICDLIQRPTRNATIQSSSSTVPTVTLHYYPYRHSVTAGAGETITSPLNFIRYFETTFAVCKGGLSFRLVSVASTNIATSNISLESYHHTSSASQKITPTSAHYQINDNTQPVMFTLPYYSTNISRSNAFPSRSYSGFAAEVYADQRIANTFMRIAMYMAAADDYSLGMQIGPPTSNTSHLAQG